MNSQSVARSTLALFLVASTAGGASAAPVASKKVAQKVSTGRTVHYAPVPAWITPPPPMSDAPTPPGAPVRVVYIDQQVRIGAAGQETYGAYRVKVLAPEALGIGNLVLSWTPASETLTVHRLAIIRDGKPIDVLAAQKFAIIQRENNLEQAMLDGNLTATLQTAGLQVGDELEFAATTTSNDPVLQISPQGFMQFPLVGARGVYRFRTLAAATRAIAYRASDDVPKPVVTTVGGEVERNYLLADPASVVLPEGAPARYGLTRLVQYSTYPDWTAVSRTFAPLFDRAAAVEPGSPVVKEAARIAAESSEAAERAQAALRVVEDRIRYVYVGLDGGNYRPATAEETWARRFGDCKAKTVLLIALLRELGIVAEPVLVASKGGDGIDQRLPTPAMFDHVVVRATIDGKRYWLDGTRLGDRRLAALEPPGSRWGLPLRSAGASLEAIAPIPAQRPQLVQVVEIDASAGFDKPGKFHVQQTLRNDEIFGMHAQLAGVAEADATRLLAAYWRKQFPDVEPARMPWRYDDDQRLLVLGMEGEGKVEWDTDEGRHTHYLYGAGFPPPDEMKRPKDQPQDAAWATDYPAFTCYATTVRVPAAGKGLHWEFSSKPMDRVLGGTAYWRIASFQDGVARMTKSRRVLTPEISAADALATNAAVSGFDNNKSYVHEVSGKPVQADHATSTPLGSFGSFEAFAGGAPPCEGSATMKTAAVTVK